MNKKLNFKKRNLWAMLALMFITLGFYSIYWFYKTNKGLKVYDKNAPSPWTLIYLNLGIFPIAILFGVLISIFGKISNSSTGLVMIMIVGGLIFLGWIFWFFYYLKRYSNSMSKVTRLISNMEAFWVMILIFAVIIIIWLIFNLILEKGSLILLLINMILDILPLCSIIYLQSIYNKVSSQNLKNKSKENSYYNSLNESKIEIKKEIPNGDYDYDMKIEKISPNEEIAKDYIKEYKSTYTKDVLFNGIINHGISENDAQIYLNKYYIGKTKSDINHSKIGLNNFFSKIYFWMFIGILISFITIITTIHFDFLYYGIYGSNIIYYGFVAIQLILLFGTQLLINYFSPKISLFLFFLYSITIGITTAGLFMIYSLNSIIPIFLTAISMFALLAIIGFKTKKNLSKLGLFLIPAMWGIFVVSLLNILVQSSNMDFIVSIIAVIVFSGLSVYDNQVYKNIYSQINSKDELNKMVVLGAMQMYINFIMIFVNLLKLFGGRD